MLLDHHVELPLQQVDLSLRQLCLPLLQPLLHHSLLALLVVQLGLKTAKLLQKKNDLDLNKLRLEILQYATAE